ncbi:MAG: hypothetical protein ACE5ER_03455 [Nitrospinaceae bacterium]
MPEFSIKRIAYYVSAHGYGHAARSATVMAQLQGAYTLHVKSEIPAAFFLKRAGPVNVHRQAVDAGCTQTNFIEVDAVRSFQNLARFYRTPTARIEKESRWLKDHRIDLVIADAPSTPLKAAADLGLPAFLAANFTWHEIYSNLPGADRYRDLLEILLAEYRSASLQFLPQCHLAKGVARRQQEVGWISPRGQCVRRRLTAARPALGKAETLVFLYLGDNDASMIDWNRLAGSTECAFITRDRLPRAALRDPFHVLDETFDYPDLVASCDLVVTKGGYSTLALAFTHGKPVITCERLDFKEFDAVRDYFAAHGVGLVLDRDRFLAGDWGPSIKKAQEISVIGKVPVHGEQAIREAVDQALAPHPTPTE